MRWITPEELLNKGEFYCFSHRKAPYVILSLFSFPSTRSIRSMMSSWKFRDVGSGGELKDIALMIPSMWHNLAMGKKALEWNTEKKTHKHSSHVIFSIEKLLKQRRKHKRRNIAEWWSITSFLCSRRRSIVSDGGGWECGKRTFIKCIVLRCGNLLFSILLLPPTEIASSHILQHNWKFSLDSEIVARKFLEYKLTN